MKYLIPKHQVPFLALNIDDRSDTTRKGYNENISKPMRFTGSDSTPFFNIILGLSKGYGDLMDNIGLGEDLLDYVYVDGSKVPVSNPLDWNYITGIAPTPGRAKGVKLERAVRKKDRWDVWDRLESNPSGFKPDGRIFNLGRPKVTSPTVTTASYVDDNISRFSFPSKHKFVKGLEEWWYKAHPNSVIPKGESLSTKAMEFEKFLKGLNLPKSITENNNKYFQLLRLRLK